MSAGSFTLIMNKILDIRAPKFVSEANGYWTRLRSATHFLALFVCFISYKKT
jgi:hypothetical protein